MEGDVNTNTEGKHALSCTVQSAVIMVLLTTVCSSSTGTALRGRRAGPSGICQGPVITSLVTWNMAASPEIHLPDKSSLLQPDWPSWWSRPMAFQSEWPLVMTCDLYSRGLKQWDRSKPGYLYLYLVSSEITGLWERETWHPSLGSHKMATMWIASPAAV